MKQPADWIDPFAHADGPPPRTLFAFVKWALSGAWRIVLAGSLLAVCVGTVEVAAAMVLGLVVDAALAAETSVFAESTWTLLGALAFFVALRPAAYVASTYFNTIVIQPNVFNLVLSRLNRYTIGQASTFFDNDFAGRIAQKEMQTARALTDVVVEMVTSILVALASFIGAILLIGTIDPRIAAGLLIWFIGYVLMIRHYMPRIRKTSKARAGARAQVTGQIVDTVTNIKTVKLFAHADHEDRAALDAMATFRDRTLSYGRVATAFRFWLVMLAGVLPVFMVGGALMLWSTGGLSAGDIAATGAVALRLAQMIGWVSHTLMALYSNVGETEDGMRTLTPRYTLLDAEDATDLEVTGGEVAIEDVTFRYGHDIGGIEDIDLTIAPGEKLAVVGASGAGKSTLVALLLRMYDAEDGRIRIDGQDIAQVTQESLRRRIGMVTQETAMFNRSAMENIRYGDPGATEDQVIEAARKAEAHDFITRMQDHEGRKGYDAHLGERGVKLSGGQRQRIALARAILKDAPILVLDEATSALDSEVEAQIQSALERVMEGKTVLAIAHRLSTIAHMDRIVVMDEGRIAEIGTHDALLAKGGLYARYWSRQSGGFISTRAAAE
ncbi:Putative multidrug export ATP-binding/permease protein [Roseivivax jejudonensis]|uniref:Putative multidrug export ATP-binding/permease protein n=2 Tax=Roseivivax jejudonensis TaxID=1529041 RepID=A0A1X6ZRS5_9RHOB|nr:ABC transporter ATP-binding protein [Roseivivax jejudonensis]SLN57730.1 Putative multidrug export ATP-binding/permease protein [Roseivivax jejudonensis]